MTRASSVLLGRRQFLGAAATVPAVAAPTRGALPPMPVCFAIGRDGAVPLVDGAWIAAHLAAVATLYGPLGIELVRRPDRELVPEEIIVDRREQRDAIALAGRPGVINVAVVARLGDVDAPPAERRGVHWRARGEPTRRCIVLSRIARPFVLPHELGHWLGLGHSKVRNDVMSYDHDDDVAPFFDALQKQVLQQNAREAFARGELEGAPRGG